MTWFLYCVSNWLLSRPFDLILSLCRKLTPFKTIWPDLDCVPNWLHWVKWSWKESVGYTMIKLGSIVLKGVNWVHNDKIGSNGLERSQLGTQYKNQVIWSWQESIGYTMTKLCQMVLKGVNWVDNSKIRSTGIERSQLGIQW